MAQEIIVITKKGYALRTEVKQFPIQKRGGVGVRLVRVKPDDEVVAVVAVEKDLELD